MKTLPASALRPGVTSRGLLFPVSLVGGERPTDDEEDLRMMKKTLSTVVYRSIDQAYSIGMKTLPYLIYCYLLGDSLFGGF